jgi:formylglycine-generating enzyme required for sulfatase activity
LALAGLALVGALLPVAAWLLWPPRDGAGGSGKSDGASVVIEPPPTPPVKDATPKRPLNDASPKRPSVASPVRNLAPLPERLTLEGIAFARIPAGKFRMGSPEGETSRAGGDQEKQHDVEITRPFMMAVYETRQRDFLRLMNYNPSYFAKNAGSKGQDGNRYGSDPGGGKNEVNDDDTLDYPVENVSHDEAVACVAELNRRTEGKRPAGYVFRLPTEAMWEYAVRGGELEKYTVFHFGNQISDTQANFDARLRYGNSPEGKGKHRTTRVGSYNLPNKFGLHDMHGNAFEWCSDWYDSKYYTKSPAADPPGPAAGSDRVLRGGCYHGDGALCRSANRFRVDPEVKFRMNGFRIALVPGG